MSTLTSINDQNLQLAPLLDSLGELIRQARQKALRAVDTLQVQPAGKSGGILLNSSRKALSGPLMASDCCQRWPSC